MDKQSVIDIWEGNKNLDPAALKAGGAKGVVIRLNDMQGGHHKDALFDSLWAMFSGTNRAIYFVYNPWVTGATNLDWLLANMPPLYRGRIFVDVEVKYDGTDATSYAAEVQYLVDRLKYTNPVTIYTGAGYIGLLRTWPKKGFWWAQYLNLVQHEPFITTWADLDARIATLPDYPSNKAQCPGAVEMWQISDHLILPGCGLKTVDINIYYGTEAELAAYFGNNGGSTTMTNTIYTNFARFPGVNKDNTIDVQVANFPGLVIAGYDGKNGTDPGNVIDPKFSEHIDKAAKMGIPAFVVFRPFMDVWQGWVNDPTWGDEWNSKVLDKIVKINATSKRQIAGIIIDLRGVTFENGNHITQGNWRRAAQWFYDNAWKAYGIGLYTFMNLSDINTMPADDQNTAVEFLNKANAMASTSLISGIVYPAGEMPVPPDNWKPNYAGTNAGRVYLSYISYGLSLPGISGGVDAWQYDRPAASMRNEIGFTTPVVTVTPAPVVTPTPVVTPDPTPVVTPTPAPVVVPQASPDVLSLLTSIDASLKKIAGLYK